MTLKCQATSPSFPFYIFIFPLTLLLGISKIPIALILSALSYFLSSTNTSGPCETYAESP